MKIFVHFIPLNFNVRLTACAVQLNGGRCFDYRRAGFEFSRCEF
ncbi:hypothetical protein CAMGR0001_1372 [Campylobacter gracilis RM3268]|uniref:Uncharacterized protein n=1 Tax=Campylobacter gracilis RM3268 TaxID=553220 RepID=C8PJH2_9BACT|nr:hypothetical protein CAMGR0001_1372 [Campylobacter gracilis RM3268]